VILLHSLRSLYTLIYTSPSRSPHHNPHHRKANGRSEPSGNHQGISKHINKKKKGEKVVKPIQSWRASFENITPSNA
jgi:hypothetical protein